MPILFFFLFAKPGFAGKGSALPYENNFDLAAGGASLTWATSEGMLFSNPAQLPYGGKIFRWLGLRTTFMAGQDSVTFLQNMVQGKSSETQDSNSFFDQVFSTPIHVGQANAFSFITNNGGISLFSRLEPDISAEKVGDLGVPTVNLSAEGYGGAIASLAIRSPWRFLSFGVSAKQLFVTEPELAFVLTDTEAINRLQENGGMDELTSYNTGLGLDAGTLIFLQGQNLDYRLSLKVDDIGDTQLSGGANPDSFKQTISAGTGITLHSDKNALHLAIDYRDVMNSYEEKMFKKIYAGAKLTLMTYIGFAAGLYQGNPTMGCELDLILFRFSATKYTRELGESPGDKRRGIFSLSIASGFDF